MEKIQVFLVNFEQPFEILSLVIDLISVIGLMVQLSLDYPYQLSVILSFKRLSHLV